MKAGWVATTLGQSCDIYQPKTISTKEMVVNGAYPVFGANGVIGRYDKFNHEEPQLLITCRGATCGSVNISAPYSWITGNAMVVRPQSTSLELKFLEYLFRGGIDLSKAITGAAQPQITRTNLAPLEFFYPESLTEQRRIVAILDEAVDSIAAAKANAEKNLQNGRALFESHLQSIFANTGDGWVNRRLEEFCAFENGDRGKNYPSKSARTATGIPFINAGHLSEDGIDFHNMDYISRERFDLLSNGKIRPSDILFCLRGSLGKFASVGNLSEGAIASSLVIVRPDKTVLTDYLLAYFRSPNCAAMIDHFKGGAAQPNLSAHSLGQFVAPIPSRAEQESIVNHLRDLRREIQRLESLYQQKLTTLDELKKSLLHQAFSGAL